MFIVSVFKINLLKLISQHYITSARNITSKDILMKKIIWII